METAEANPRLEPAPYKWLVVIAVMIGCAIEVIDSSIVNVSLPHMQGSFSSSLDEIAWVLTVPEFAWPNPGGRQPFSVALIGTISQGLAPSAGAAS